MSGSLEMVDDGNPRLVGEIEFDEAMAIKAEGTRLCQAADAEIVFDLSGITQANSVTVALLLEWARVGARSGSDVAFSGLSEDLSKIIKVSGLSELIRRH